MTNYVTKALNKFQQPTPRRDQHEHHQWNRPNYSPTKKPETLLDNSPSTAEERNTRIQQIVVNLLYYAHAVDCTIMP